MAQPVKGVTYPKKLYPSVQAAIHDVGGVRGTDYENAGQIDAINDNVAALTSRVAVVENKAALVPYQQCGDGSPFVGTGVDQVIPHGLGVTPAFPMLTPVAGFDDSRFDIVSWNATQVVVKVSLDCEFRLYVFR